MPFMPTTALASGVQRQSETQTVTTDPNTYTVTAVFDCVLPTIVAFTIMATVFTPDGETFGDQPGDILGVLDTIQQSADGITWVNLTALVTDNSHLDAVNAFTVAGNYQLVIYPTFRYVRVPFQVVDDNFDPYAGPNHPTVTLAISALWV